MLRSSSSSNRVTKTNTHAGASGASRMMPNRSLARSSCVSAGQQQQKHRRRQGSEAGAVPAHLSDKDKYIIVLSNNNAFYRQVISDRDCTILDQKQQIRDLESALTSCQAGKKEEAGQLQAQVATLKQVNQAVLKLAHAFKAELKNELQDKGALVDKIQALEADNKALEAERAALLLKLQEFEALTPAAEPASAETNSDIQALPGVQVNTAAAAAAEPTTKTADKDTAANETAPVPVNNCIDLAESSITSPAAPEPSSDTETPQTPTSVVIVDQPATSPAALEAPTSPAAPQTPTSAVDPEAVDSEAPAAPAAPTPSGDSIQDPPVSATPFPAGTLSITPPVKSSSGDWADEVEDADAEGWLPTSPRCLPSWAVTSQQLQQEAQAEQQQEAEAKAKQQQHQEEAKAEQQQQQQQLQADPAPQEPTTPLTGAGRQQQQQQQQQEEAARASQGSTTPLRHAVRNLQQQQQQQQQQAALAPKGPTTPLRCAGRTAAAAAGVRGIFSRALAALPAGNGNGLASAPTYNSNTRSSTGGDSWPSPPFSVSASPPQADDSWASYTSSSSDTCSSTRSSNARSSSSGDSWASYDCSSDTRSSTGGGWSNGGGNSCQAGGNRRSHSGSGYGNARSSGGNNYDGGNNPCSNGGGRNTTRSAGGSRARNSSSGGSRNTGYSGVNSGGYGYQQAAGGMRPKSATGATRKLVHNTAAAGVLSSSAAAFLWQQ